MAYWQGVFGDISDTKNPNSLLEMVKQSDKKQSSMSGVGKKIFSLMAIKRRLLL
jgi:putative tributyrin esterase